MRDWISSALMRVKRESFLCHPEAMRPCYLAGQRPACMGIFLGKTARCSGRDALDRAETLPQTVIRLTVACSLDSYNHFHVTFVQEMSCIGKGPSL